MRCCSLQTAPLSSVFVGMQGSEMTLITVMHQSRRLSLRCRPVWNDGCHRRRPCWSPETRLAPLFRACWSNGRRWWRTISHSLPRSHSTVSFPDSTDKECTVSLSLKAQHRNLRPDFVATHLNVHACVIVQRPCPCSTAQGEVALLQVPASLVSRLWAASDKRTFSQLHNHCRDID